MWGEDKMFEATKSDELRADIRNKMSPILFFIQAAYDERLPMEMREKTRLQAENNLYYILKLIKEFD